MSKMAIRYSLRLLSKCATTGWLQAQRMRLHPFSSINQVDQRKPHQYPCPETNLISGMVSMNSTSISLLDFSIHTISGKRLSPPDIIAKLSDDGVFLPDISMMDNGSCVELLRGAVIGERAQRKPGGLLGVLNKACSFKSGTDCESRNDDLAQDLSTRYSVHTFAVLLTAVCFSASITSCRGKSQKGWRYYRPNPSVFSAPSSTDSLVWTQTTTSMNFSLFEFFSSLDRTRSWSIFCI